MLPLNVCRSEVILGRGELGTEQIDQGISDLDLLAPLGKDLDDERIEAGPNLASVLGS